jgi:hypothetical protein
MSVRHQLPPSCAVAFKEWSGVCAALEAGRQIIILRKGGIAEGPGGFQPEHEVFWLYPTHVHEAQQGLREAFPDRGPARPDVVSLSALARVIFVERLPRREILERIEPFHIWTAETVARRFEYRTPGLWLLAVRVFRRDEPWPVAVTPEQAGCKTWVMLEQALPTEGLRPVGEDAEFARQLEALRKALADAEEVTTA